MKEIIIQLFTDYLPVILSGLVAVFSAVVSLLCYKLKSKTREAQLQAMRDQIEAIRSNGTFLICPKCKEKSYLSEVDFYNSKGQVDNDLDGKAD